MHTSILREGKCGKCAKIKITKKKEKYFRHRNYENPVIVIRINSFAEPVQNEFKTKIEDEESRKVLQSKIMTYIIVV